jgi:hypothetical protein
MLILRSPVSGVLRTFVDSSEVKGEDIQTLVAEKYSKEVKMCVNPKGLLTGAEMAIVIDANTTSASGIETLGDNNGC